MAADDPDDTDDTSPIRLAAEDGPAERLTRPPTPREHMLAEQLGLHDGAPVPFWMFAKVVMAQEEHGRWIGKKAALESRIRRKVWASLLAMAANLLLAAGMAVHWIKESGAAEERDAQQARSFLEYRETVRRELDRLEQDIRDLRRDLRRIGGAEPDHGISIVRRDGP